MQYRRRPKQESPYSAIKRVRYWLSRAGGTRLQKSQGLRFVTFNDHRFKRLILRDSYLAAEIEQTLERYGPTPMLPPLVIRYEHEVWLEFVEGERLTAKDDASARRIARLLAAINARDAHAAALSETIFDHRLGFDLRFLAKVEVIDGATHRKLVEAANRLKPDTVWIGFDYLDPVLKNFVHREDDDAKGSGLTAVDVESLKADQLIGTGAAKALVRWMEPHRQIFLDEYAAAGGPDILGYFDYVELAFLAKYTKEMFLEQKWRHVDPSLFGRFTG